MSEVAKRERLEMSDEDRAREHILRHWYEEGSLGDREYERAVAALAKDFAEVRGGKP